MYVYEIQLFFICCVPGTTLQAQTTAKKTPVLHEFTLTPNVNKPRRFALCPAVAAREGGKATLTLASFHDWIDNWELCRCSHEISGILYVMVTGNCELL